MLSFHREMIRDLYNEDGLLIMAHGLGMSILLEGILPIHTPSHLVLLINVPECEQPPGIVVISGTTLSNQRKAVYLQGGVISVTSRILVVDMLNANIPIHLISGIIVGNAHRVSESSNEAFILKLYRDSNKTGFIRCLSESPEHFTNGINKLQKTMRNLFLRQVTLWPRFHVKVTERLDERQVELIELRVPLTSRMSKLQSAILDCLHQCILEIKRLNPAVFNY